MLVYRTWAGFVVPGKAPAIMIAGYAMHSCCARLPGVRAVPWPRTTIFINLGVDDMHAAGMTFHAGRFVLESNSTAPLPTPGFIAAAS